MDTFRQSPSNHLEPLPPIVSFRPPVIVCRIEVRKSSNASNTIHVDDLVQSPSVRKFSTNHIPSIRVATLL